MLATSGRDSVCKSEAPKVGRMAAPTANTASCHKDGHTPEQAAAATLRHAGYAVQESLHCFHITMPSRLPKLAAGDPIADTKAATRDGNHS